MKVIIIMSVVVLVAVFSSLIKSWWTESLTDLQWWVTYHSTPVTPSNIYDGILTPTALLILIQSSSGGSSSLQYKLNPVGAWKITVKKIIINCLLSTIQFEYSGNIKDYSEDYTLNYLLHTMYIGKTKRLLSGKMSLVDHKVNT